MNEAGQLITFPNPASGSFCTSPGVTPSISGSYSFTGDPKGTVTITKMSMPPEPTPFPWKGPITGGTTKQGPALLSGTITLSTIKYPFKLDWNAINGNLNGTFAFNGVTYQVTGKID